MTYRSPLLDLPGAVAADAPDAGIAAHYGSFNQEQRTLSAGKGFVDLSNRDVFRVSGPDRLTYLHSVTTQYFDGLEPGKQVSALILDPNGRVEHAFVGVDDGESFLAHTEPGAGADLIGFLDRMRFLMQVETVPVTDLAVVWRPEGEGRFELTADLAAYGAQHGPAAGLWAYEALRIARGEPRLGIDTDAKAIPNEMGWIDSAVHLDKGCYRGQETVAKIHNLGKPPRRIVRLHLDGSVDRLPERGAAVSVAGAEGEVGFVGSSARHFELGPIALALVKRGVDVDAGLVVDGIPASQDVIVDPGVGLHVRANLGVDQGARKSLLSGHDH